MNNRKLLSFSTLLAIVAGALPLHAGFHTWTGGGGANAQWSNQANWKENKPYVGEPLPVDVIFPANAAGSSSIMDMPGLQVSYIGIYKDGFTLTASAPVQIPLVDVNGGAGLLNCSTNVHGMISSPIELTIPNGVVVFNGDPYSGSLELACKISGAGDLTVDVGGELILSGSVGNTYAGKTWVLVDVDYYDDTGWLVLNKSSGLAVAGDLEVEADYDWYWDQYFMAGVTALANNQISSSSAVVLLGRMFMSNTVQTVGALTVANAFLFMGNGTLTLNGDLNLSTYEDYYNTYPETIVQGHLDLGTVPAGRAQARLIYTQGVVDLNAAISGNPGITLKSMGPGELHLQSANTYSGPTIIAGGTLFAQNNLSLGATNNGTTVAAGATLLLSNGMTLAEPLILNGSGVSSNGALAVPDPYYYWNSSFTVSGPVTLGSPTLMNIPSQSQITLSGPVSGLGSLTKIGDGELDMSGNSANTFTGGMFMNGGMLGLLKSAYSVSIPGPFVIGDGIPGAPPFPADEVDCYHEGQIGPTAAVTVNSSGLLQLYADTDVGPLTLYQGTVDTSTAMLRLNGDLTTIPGAGASTISGKFDLTADRTFNIGQGLGLGPDVYIPAVITSGFLAGFTKTGAGWLDISGVNVFSGSVLVQQGALSLGNNSALGGSLLGTTIASGASLTLDKSIWILNESLTLSNNATLHATDGTNLWGGPITVSSNAYFYVGDSNVVLLASNVINGSGNLIKQGTGKLTFNGNYTNMYAGTTTVTGGILELSKTNAIAIPGALIIGDQVNPVNSHAVRLVMPNQIADNAAVTVNSSGLLDLTSPYAGDVIGSLAGSGNLNLGGHSLYTGGNNTSTAFAGAISGSGSSALLKQGSGTMSLNGNSPNFLGSTVINAGTLSVNGSQPNSSVSIKSGATLQGNGNTGYTVANGGGKLAPGNSPGLLKSGTVSLDPFSTFEVELNGTAAGVNYDQLNVTGAVNLNGVILHVVLGFNSAQSNQFVLIANDGVDPVNGTFSGLSEGAKLVLGGAQFQITYKGGDGNDVVLTQVTPITPPQLGGVQKLPNGSIQITATGLPNTLYHVQATDSLMPPVQWVDIGTATSDGQGSIQFIDPDAPNHPVRFYRLVLP